jgi:hypothetical protein
VLVLQHHDGGVVAVPGVRQFGVELLDRDDANSMDGLRLNVETDRFARARSDVREQLLLP